MALGGIYNVHIIYTRVYYLQLEGKKATLLLALLLFEYCTEAHQPTDQPTNQADEQKEKKTCDRQ